MALSVTLNMVRPSSLRQAIKHMPVLWLVLSSLVFALPDSLHKVDPLADSQNTAL